MSRPAETTLFDPADPNLVQGGMSGFDRLRPFNQAGVLAAADVHAAIRLCRLAGSADEQLALAIALAVRAPRVGHVSVDLTDIRASAVEAAEEVDLDLLPWPETEPWIAAVAASDLVDVEPVDTGRPLKLVGHDLYLERYWRDEVDVAVEILGRLGAGERPATGVGERPAMGVGERPATGGGEAPAMGGGEAPATPGRLLAEERLRRLFPGAGSSDQLAAARLVLSHRFSVVGGGPGTGKTTTVARLLAVVFEEAAARGERLPLVGLAAPTGKAAARMEEAVRAEVARVETTPDVRAALREVNGSTLHRLLGTRFDRPGRFRHHRGHRLPHDIVVVDEASMVSLSMMASLVQAVRPDARLVLVGDPEQLVSVEAGAVLADIVGPAGRGVAGGSPAAGGTGVAGGSPAADGSPAVSGRTASAPAVAPRSVGPEPAIAGSICILRQNHRFAGSLARLSAAVQAGDDQSVMEIMAEGDAALSWIEADPSELLLGGAETGSSSQLEDLRASTVNWAVSVRELAAAGDTEGAIRGLRRHRVLCAHRRGAAGVRAWTRVIQEWMAAGSDPTRPDAAGTDDSWYPGRPVMVTVNDYALRLFNGDAGVAVAVGGEGGPGSGRLAVAFDEGADRPARMVSPTRLNGVETVYAMTVHKSQGSEFDRVTLLLPPAGSRLLTRELLYTAITRARHAVTVVGTVEALRTSVRTPIARASGLGGRLWGDAAR